LEEIEESRLQEVAEIFLACLQEQYIDVLPETVRNNFTPESSLDLWRKSFKNMNNMQMVGAFIGGDLAGFTKFGSEEADPTIGYLASLYVSPHFARRGVGKALLESALEQMHGFKYINLWVFKGNSPAIALYSNHGFVNTGVERVEEEWETPQTQMQLNNF
jgi:ribosomal protein S18 acetylase RimI-like enzyme